MGSNRCFGRLILASAILSLAATVLGQATVNLPPGGQMIQPTNAELIRSTGPTTLRARMSDPDGTVTSVRFYSESGFLGTGTPSPSNEFVLSWSPGRIGNFSFYAVAVDDKGATGKTATVWISVATNAPSFCVIELETGDTNSFFVPWAINDQGVIVGSVGDVSTVTTDEAVARWSGWRCDKFPVSGKHGRAQGVREDGTAVGYLSDNGWQYPVFDYPFVLTPDGSLTLLSGVVDGRATSISRAGIVGSGLTNRTNSSYSAFIYDGEQYTFLNTGGRWCQALDINDEGLIVGSVDTTTPFIYQAGELTLLATNVASGSASAINRNAQVVGTVGGMAFLYERGAMSNMGTLGVQHTALDINDAGTAVGYYSRDSVNPPSAFIFHDGVMIDLNRLIPSYSNWRIREAHAINNQGWIVGGDGYAFYPSRGLLLVPKPMIRVIRATSATIEGKAYLTDAPATFETSTDLKAWRPLSPIASGTPEESFTFSLDPTNSAVFYRIRQLSTP